MLKWLTGESRNDPPSRFVLGDGDLDIEDVCNRWAAGRFDAGVFKEDWRFPTKVESQYLAQLYAATGRNARPVASVATRTISEFTALRQEMRTTAQRVPVA